MLVTCSYCGGIHPRGFKCKSKPKQVKTITTASKFRSKRIWTEKARLIKARDRFLCQWCLSQEDKHVFDGLEVHHIIPISMNWDKRLDDYNLITLCNYHHKQADKGLLNNGILFDIAFNNTVNDEQRNI